ncbi:signal recognition particle receptor subunit beta [Streptomyces umbrinus]|uniref:Signal recognition particle receptor subunit beta n=1 Tax=Streptomyces umbrinus TaxID=67370 RepID=A0ABU0SUL9_9ACTN|nr:signal recognition particle receptor subunit beta [Streptomyces umbrinus]
MDSATSEPTADARTPDAHAAEDRAPEDPAPEDRAPEVRTPLEASADNGLKIVVVGGFGVGKTTMIHSVSEIRPLSTEETITGAGGTVDDVSAVPGKSRTTVAFDFGRITLSARTVLYLFGAPGQERFWYLWDRLFTGALGAVVLVDTRRIDDSWYAIDRLERLGTPFIVARNDFGGPAHTPEQVRDALDLAPHIPLVDCDARSRDSGKRVLITLIEHIKSLYLAEDPQVIERVRAARSPYAAEGAAGTPQDQATAPTQELAR